MLAYHIMAFISETGGCEVAELVPLQAINEFDSCHLLQSWGKGRVHARAYTTSRFLGSFFFLTSQFLPIKFTVFANLIHKRWNLVGTPGFLPGQSSQTPNLSPEERALAVRLQLSEAKAVVERKSFYGFPLYYRPRFILPLWP